MATPQDYKITRADFISEKHAKAFDLSPSVSELIIFENLSKAFLTGRILIVDTLNFFNSIKFTGTEKLELEISHPSAQKKTELKTFFVTRVEKSVRVNDTTEVYMFHLLEEHAFVSRIQKLSRSFKGAPLIIIENVLAEIDILKTLDTSRVISQPAQENIRLVSPYITPLQIIDWVKDRMTTIDGFPFFIYSSLKDANIKVISLQDLLLEDAWNKNSPFTYSQASTNQNNSASEKAFFIQKVTTTNTDDTLTAITDGGVVASYEVLDIFKQTKNSEFTRKFNINDVLSTPDRENAIFDVDTVIGTKKLSEYSAKNFFQVVATSLYNDNSYGYHEDDNLDKLITKLKNKGLRIAMTKNMIDVELSGIPFMLADKATVGTLIELQFINPKNGVDPKKSGKYITMALRHQYSGTSHTVTASVTKLVNDNTTVPV
jgi:hypothetical protein